ncbi:hypothetical protein RclHR1_00190005 [Rhizophagus clarus]|uniref:Uncharacterized protein n=1 Tax=Rhizophagus clarus TaxID=94130 RepID=A0A2Z6QSJ4_9GLOM|nr:hypothetical protein RclHR1_00190005 [Rhizophagus clarus]GES90361.1 hypothetical protein GLOIN_2v1655508 [Rhizophagus clarus]
MAANTQRNSTNNTPTVTIVDSTEPRRKYRAMGSCCFCVPEIVGVFAILSMYFFTGIVGAAASFLSLGYSDDGLTKAILSISGSLHTLAAIASALSVGAIKKEKIVLMLRLSIAFWVLTSSVIILNVIILVLDFNSRNASVNECVKSLSDNNVGGYVDLIDNCERVVSAALIGEAIRFFVVGSILLYFAYVIFRFARNMNKEVLPFTGSSAPISGQNTPTYFVYSAQPPTSNNWVPPPTYTVRPTYLPDDLNPDSKNPN